MYHGHNLGLHLTHAREHVGVDRVGDGEPAKGLRLQPYQLVAAVVDGAADSPVFPARVLHVGQFAELLAHILLAPSAARQAGDALDARAAGHELALKLEHCFGDLHLHFRPHARQAQEDAIEVAAHVDVEFADGAEEAASLELVEELARPSQEEEDEDDVAQHVDVQGEELALGGALARVERVAQTDGQTRRAGHLGLNSVEDYSCGEREGIVLGRDRVR